VEAGKAEVGTARAARTAEGRKSKTSHAASKIRAAGSFKQ
jgi:hypothetical protein